MSQEEHANQTLPFPSFSFFAIKRFVSLSGNISMWLTASIQTLPCSSTGVWCNDASMFPPTCAPPVKRAGPGNISACIASLTCKGTKSHNPVGEVTGYWLFACSAPTAKVNRWASHLFTPSPASDRQSHGTEPRGRHIVFGQWCGLLTVSGDALLYVLPDQAVEFRWGNFANRHICFHLMSLWRQICGSFRLEERKDEKMKDQG